MAHKKLFILYKRKSKKTGGKEIYYAIFRDETGERLPAESTGETNKNAAEAWCINQLKMRKRIRNMTLSEFSIDFFDYEKCQWIKRQLAQGQPFSRPVARDRRAHLDTYILPTFGKYKLEEIKAGKISDFLLSLQLSNQTRNHILYTFRIVMDEAVFRDLCEYNPVRNVKRFADTHEKRDIFLDDEISRLFPENKEKLLEIWQGPYWSTMFYTMLTSGIRLGEARALLWANIDWSIKALTVTQAIKADMTIGKPKNREERAVYLPDRTMIMLSEWQKLSQYNSINDLIFYGSNGQTPINKKTAWKYFTHSLKKAGIGTEGRVLVIHSLRHTYNTAMRKVISEAFLRFQIGHRDVKMTDRYDGAGPLDRLKIFLPEREKINEIWK